MSWGLSILGPLLKTKYHSLSILISTCFYHRFSLISVLSFSQLSSTFEITQRTVIKIDCGIDSPTPISDSTRWLPDQFYTGGVTALISSNTTSDTNLLPMTSIRHFPLSYGKKICYSFSLPSSLYRIGLSFAYGNYNNMIHASSRFWGSSGWYSGDEATLLASN